MAPTVRGLPAPGDERPAAPPWPDDAVEVGRILGAWGIKGALKVQPFAADPQALFASACWFLQPAQGRPAVRPPGALSASSPSTPRTLPVALHVHGVRDQGDAIVALAAEVPDRDAAEALKGVRVFVSRACFPAPEGDEFYWVDLIGSAVTNRQGVALGEVVGLIDTGPHCVLRVRPPAGGEGATAEGEERLIPFVDAYVDAVDVPGRRITVDWGLDF